MELLGKERDQFTVAYNHKYTETDHYTLKSNYIQLEEFTHRKHQP